VAQDLFRHRIVMEVHHILIIQFLAMEDWAAAAAGQVVDIQAPPAAARAATAEPFGEATAAAVAPAATQVTAGTDQLLATRMVAMAQEEVAAVAAGRLAAAHKEPVTAEV